MSRVAYEKHNELSVSIPSRKTLSINHIAKNVRLGYKGKVIRESLYLLEIFQTSILY